MSERVEKRYRNFVFTDYRLDEEYLKSVKCIYMMFGLEICPTSGKNHFQGFVHFENTKSHRAVRAILGCHCEPMVGSIEENIKYCSKEGKWKEFGVKPLSNSDKGRAEQLSWLVALNQAKAGDLESIQASKRIRYYCTFDKIALKYKPKPLPLEDVCGLWIYGPTGTGKTYEVKKKWPDRYIKPSKLQWWANYEGQEVVHYEEMYPPKHPGELAQYLKVWADTEPFQAELKGGYVWARPQIFVITSNYSIDEMGFGFNDTPAIKRRFKEIFKHGREISIE